MFKKREKEKSLQIIHRDYLVDPADERGYFDINSRHVHAATTKSPGNETSQLIKSVVLANQWSTTVTLKHLKRYCI